MANWKLNAKSIKEQIAEAKEKTRIADALEPRAKTAVYDPTTGRIVITLSNGADFSFYASSIPELATVSAPEIARVEISPSGRTLRWKALDADLSLAGLMMGVFGSKIWMAQLGQRGGQSTSAAKARASRLNGKKGGRPANRVAHLAPRSLSASSSRSARSVAGSALTQRDKKSRTDRAASRLSDRKLVAKGRKK
jgi:hypothetical protein